MRHHASSIFTCPRDSLLISSIAVCCLVEAPGASRFSPNYISGDMKGKHAVEAEKRKYPIGPEHYVLYEEIGQGVSAAVHRALCEPFDEIVAIKILDFERDNCDLVAPLSLICVNFDLNRSLCYFFFFFDSLILYQLYKRLMCSS